MRRFRTHVTHFLLLTFLLQTLCPTTVLADDFFGRFARLVKEGYHGTPPKVCQDCAVEYLAENIDWLEHHIDRYGSIVAKQPDIWGEARLTKHRDEYERIMYQELNQFQFKLNAAISQSDSSFLAQALALSAAAGDQSVPTIEAKGTTTSTSIGDTKAILRGAGTSGQPASTFGDFGTASQPKINIEPTIFLDQLSRYLQHLHELRRINEGDDTSDSPGYSMTLVRIPVSLLPGKLTRTGFGGEITITATPVLSDDLLPTTFRNLVINDLVDQLGLPLVRTVENVEQVTQYRNKLEETKQAKQAIKTAASVINEWNLLNSIVDRRECKKLVSPLVDNPSARKALQLAIDELVFQSESEGLDEIIASVNDDEREKRLQDYGDLITANIKFVNDNLAEFAIKILAEKKSPSKQNRNDAKAALEKAVIALGMIDEEIKKLDKQIESNNKTDITFKLQKLGFEYTPGNKGPVGIRGTCSSPRAAIEESTRDLKRHKNQLSEVLVVMSGTASSALNSLQTEVRRDIVTSSVSASGRSRRATQPVPPSQLLDVYGFDLFFATSEFFCPAYSGRQVRWNGKSYCTFLPKCNPPNEYRIDLLDAQKWLSAELSAAHEFLSRPQYMWLWHELAKPSSGLASAIRSGHLGTEAHQVLPYILEESLPAPGESVRTPAPEGLDLKGPATVATFRKYFFDNLHQLPHKNTLDERQQVIENLAWAIVVESALLNERLNDDIRKTAVSKGCHCMGIGDRDLTFFLPEAAGREESPLSGEFITATKAFQEYVACRWPIHVFAIDPREQDQNVADVSSRKRELQFALALGFTNGQIGANSLTQYSRNLETQIETISLNRTIVGFGHGEDTFGWQFYPRVQALHVPGTLGAIKETICGVGRDDDLRKRQLEPGMRECVAIVLMPSFVPYADFDIRTNWFKLTNPKNAALTMKHTMRLSKAITAMRRSKAQCAKCAHCYRPGEIGHLMTRVDQLDRELPLQSMRAQIPYENTLGGFEMFNTGVTDLSPELIGWYGAPGVVIQGDNNCYKCGCEVECEATDAENLIASHVDGLHANSKIASGKSQPLPTCEGAGTTLFLVGDNFSVHDTKIIAGGVCIPHVRLISREIMRVTIPSCVNTVQIDGKDYVAVYAATPYGVTNHLHVPIHCRKGTKNLSKPCGEQTAANADTDTPKEEEKKEKEASDSCAWQLIPLPEVRSPYALTSAMQPLSSPEEAIAALNNATTRIEAVVEAQANVVPTEFVVNVQSTEASTQAVAGQSKHADRKGPVAKQLHTKMRECWHNLRDKLPCN